MGARASAEAGGGRAPPGTGEGREAAAGARVKGKHRGWAGSAGQRKKEEEAGGDGASPGPLAGDSGGMEVRVPGLSPRCHRAATGPRAKVRVVEGAGQDRAGGGGGRYQLSWLFPSFSAPLFPSAVAPSSTPSPVPAGHSSPAPLSPREQPEGTRPMPRAGRDAVPEEGRCEGTRCLGRPAARAQAPGTRWPHFVSPW